MTFRNDEANMPRRSFIGKMGLGVAGIVGASLLPSAVSDRLSEQAYASTATGVYNVNDYPSIADAINAAQTNGGGTVLFPSGAYPVASNLLFPGTVDAEFKSGASLSIASGVAVTVEGGLIAGFHQIFAGSGTAIIANARIDAALPEWFGTGGLNDSPAIQKAIDAFDVVSFRSAVYRLATTVTLPQSRRLELVGKGYRNTIFHIAASTTGLVFVRNPSVGGITMKVTGIRFQEDGDGKTSTGISFQGSDNLHHDNWLRMVDCSFHGLAKAVYLKYCGNCHFVGCYAQNNSYVYYMERDASFIWFDRCMNLDNRTFVYADDPLADGISNGIMINNCASVFCTHEDIRIIGWQAVYITGGGGLDLGGRGGGMNSVYLGKCMDITIRDMWVASDKDHITNRVGIQLIDSHTGIISGCSIVNNTIGIRIDGNSGFASKFTISGNKFEGNVTNDILFGGNVKAVNVTDNHFISTVSRTGTNYEVYTNTLGSNYNIIKNNTFKGASYTMIAGSNSIVGDNIFGVPDL